jgi:hypothetical protein
MNRSLALLTLLVLALLSFAGTASAKQTSLKGIFAISGDSAFIQTKPNKLVVRNLRTGSVRRANYPSNAAPGDALIRVNSHAVASVTGFSEANLVLQLNGVDMKPRVLATVPHGSGCAAGTDLIVLQLDRDDTVTALRRGWAPTSGGCQIDLAQLRITKFFRNGSSQDVAIPEPLKLRVATMAQELSLRGNNLLIPGGSGVGEISTVLDLTTGKTVWEGARPAAYFSSLPSPDVIFSSIDYLGHSSRAYRFNYKTGKAVTIRIPHPRAGDACGKFTVFASGHALEIYDEKGRVVRRARPRWSEPYLGGQNICSSKFAYIPHYKGSAELIDLTKLG